MKPRIVVLTGRAARWVKVLEEFGHLTPEGVDRLYVGVGELAAETGHPEDLPVDVDLVRRAAAMILVPAGNDPLTPILEEDWPLLFS